MSPQHYLSTPTLNLPRESLYSVHTYLRLLPKSGRKSTTSSTFEFRIDKAVESAIRSEGDRPTTNRKCSRGSCSERRTVQKTKTYFHQVGQREHATFELVRIRRAPFAVSTIRDRNRQRRCKMNRIFQRIIVNRGIIPVYTSPTYV